MSSKPDRLSDGIDVYMRTEAGKNRALDTAMLFGILRLVCEKAERVEEDNRHLTRRVDDLRHRVAVLETKQRGHHH